jgi:hypothetical protein
MIWFEAAIVGAAIAGSWSAHLFGWLGEVPRLALAVAAGLPLTAWAARMYLVRKGVALDRDFRPHAWEKAGQRATVGCLVIAFGTLTAAAAQMPFRPPAAYMWYVSLGAKAAFAAAAVCLLLTAYSLQRKWRSRMR